MNENLGIWNALYRTDPKHVKPITGKSYSGDSPKPHYIIFRLTEQFGPAGKGFGWEVHESAYIDGIPHQDGTEKLHECRITFWWRAGDGDIGSLDSFGATKALYKTNSGKWVSDEDAAKKSLTDAIVKAASWLGAAGDIFMGQWNDSKYQAELRNPPEGKGSFVTSCASFVTSEPPHDPVTGEVDDDDRDPPSVRAFMDQVRETLAMSGNTKPSRDDLERAYAFAVIENLGKRKQSARAKPWFDIFCSLHEDAIGRIQNTDLKRQVRSAIALKQAQINGEKADPADFGHPFGPATRGTEMHP